MVLCAGAFGGYAAQGSLPGAQGQGYDLNLSYSRTTLKAVADAITQQAGIAFSYETALAGYPMENLEVSEKGATIEAILATVFTPRGIDYRVVDKVVVLTRSTRPVPAARAAAKSEVKGVVRDAAGNPMIGVTVTIKGTLVGVSTGVDGGYAIPADGNATLLFSYIGYRPHEEVVGRRTQIDVTMQEDELVMDEVVVVGYGTLKKRNIVGAVENLSGDAVENRPNANITRSLQGQIPGLNIVQVDGKADHAGEVTIRGVNNTFKARVSGGEKTNKLGQGGGALVLIDGAEGDMGSVNPDDIASISVLKDASSAAVYGARGAFGVILITTKNPEKGKVRVSYNGSVSLHRRTVSSQWGFFPSASVGWRLSEEPWLKPHVEGWLDNFKVRASIGSLGNANIDPYQYLETMTASGSASIAKSSVIINGQNVPYTSVPSLIPDDITWEKVTTYNIGLDLDLFHNRLSFTGDYYRRNTTDLYTVGPNLPQVLGSAAPYGNYASLKTKGWELSLSWRDSFNLGGKPFSYSIKGMLWDSRSWITDYYNETGDLTTYYKGMEIGEIWGFRTAGIYASNADALNGPAYNFFKNGEMFRAYAGDLRFVDVDGDGIMTKGNRTLSNHGDLEIIGNQSPRYQYSINMSLNWNGIGLSMLWQGVGKRDWYPWTESGFFWGKWNRAYNSLMKTQTGDNVVRIDKSTDNWRVTNMDKNPYWTRMVSLAANRNDGPLTWENDHYLQDASYIRLKNITIDYTFPKHICKKLRLEGLKVYLSGENLFTHSPMFKHTDMFDPEVITSGDSDFAASTTSGLNGTGNGYSYPMLKTVTLGINVTF